MSGSRKTGDKSASGRGAAPTVVPVDFVRRVLDHELYSCQLELFSLIDDIHQATEDLVEIAESPRLVINKNRGQGELVLRARKLCVLLDVLEDE